MKDNNNMGYTKDEYYQISAKHGLPNRCPILGNCCRAVETRYEMGMRLGGSDISFEEFMRSKGHKWSPDAMVKSIEQVSWSYAHDVLKSVENVCPEVTLFEPEYLDFNFRQSAFGYASYYKDTRRFEAEPKHYRECAEFSNYSFHHKGRNLSKDARLSYLTPQIPEKVLEDYLENNLELLEPGLKFVERQKTIGKWKADIFASDASGVDVLIELKAKVLSRDEVDRLCGQISRYYNHLKSRTHDLRVFIVIPRNNDSIIDNLYHVLKQWMENNKVTVFQFDYSLYSKTFVFSKLRF